MYLLDFSISNMTTFNTSVYHKSTYTCVLTNFKSFVPLEYKSRLIDTLQVGQVSIWMLEKYKLRNLYPKRLIDKNKEIFGQNKLMLINKMKF